MPDKFKTEELCYKALEYDIEMFKYIPDELMTQEMVDIGTEVFYNYFIYVPDRFKTQEMCEEFVQYDLNMMEYVPKEYQLEVFNAIMNKKNNQEKEEELEL